MAKNSFPIPLALQPHLRVTYQFFDLHRNDSYASAQENYYLTPEMSFRKSKGDGK